MTTPSKAPVSAATLDRNQVERILARAAELQGSGADQEGKLSVAELEALAKEVGLDTVNLRQALAEERTRISVDEQPGFLNTVYGVADISASRLVTGSPQPVLRALDDWMIRQEGLIQQRAFGDRIVWETRSDLVGVIRRLASGRGYALARTTHVAATVVEIDEKRSLVRMDAHLGGHRRNLAGQTVALTGAAAIGGGVLALMSFAVAAVVAPPIIVAPVAYFASRSAHRHAVSRAQLAMEQILDRLERSQPGRPSLMGMLAAAVQFPKL